MDFRTPLFEQLEDVIARAPGDTVSIAVQIRTDSISYRVVLRSPADPEGAPAHTAYGHGLTLQAAVDRAVGAEWEESSPHVDE